MALQVIKELRKEGFQYVVAPFEADAQLAYLEKRGIISGAISEDSDLVVFGCRNIVFKLDQYGEAAIFDRSLMDNVKAVDIKGWSKESIRYMCILSGCDYHPSIPGVGLKKAYRYVSRSKNGLKGAVALMRADGLSIPEGYEEDVERANLTFQYQRVYDPVAKCLAHVSEPKDDVEQRRIDAMVFIGENMEPSVAESIATGAFDPITRTAFSTAAQPGGANAAPAVALVTVVQSKALPTKPYGTPAAVSAPVRAATLTPTRSASKASGSTSSTTPASAKAKSLLSFWAKPDASKSTRNSKSDKAVSSASPTPTPTQNAICIYESDEASVDSDSVIEVRFRARDARDGDAVETSYQSRFFSKSNKGPQSASDSQALSVGDSQTPSTPTTAGCGWPETPSNYVNSQDISQSPTQVEEGNDSKDGLCDLFTSEQLAASTLSAPDKPLPSKVDKESNKGAYYLFDRIVGTKRRVPKWAAFPIYRDNVCDGDTGDGCQKSP
ncbi:Rad2 nuclease [Coemansia sp. Benny D115]|nr:Rad2 nuclease [Coemansia sp. Benny D115]